MREETRSIINFAFFKFKLISKAENIESKQNDKIFVGKNPLTGIYVEAQEQTIFMTNFVTAAIYVITPEEPLFSEHECFHGAQIFTMSK